jgi:hypothetical protein
LQNCHFTFFKQFCLSIFSCQLFSSSNEDPISIIWGVYLYIYFPFSFRVKYPIDTWVLNVFKFSTWVFIYIIGDTWVRGKNSFGTSVRFFILKLTVCHVALEDVAMGVVRSPQGPKPIILFYFILFYCHGVVHGVALFFFNFFICFVFYFYIIFNFFYSWHVADC